MSADDPTTSVEFREISDVPGYRFLSDGRVQSCWGGSGRGSYLSSQWHDLKLTGSPGRRYLMVCIKRGGRRFKTAVHPLIAEAFFGPCPPGMECRHKDDDPRNNRIGNLCWGTRSENIADRKRNGIQIQGERQWQARLTQDEIRRIRDLYKAGGMTYSDLAVQFGVCFQHIQSIVKRERWKHVV